MSRALADAPMLNFFRKGGVSNLLVGGIVSAIIIAFIVEFRAGQGTTGDLKIACVVEYGAECVAPKDYFAAYGIVARGLEPAAAKRLALRKVVLDGLVERTLLVESARKLGLGVSEAAIDTELEAGRVHVSVPAQSLEEISGRIGLCRIDPSGGGCEPGVERGVRQLRVRRTPTEPFDYKLYEREIRILANRGPREFKESQELELLAARMRGLVRSRARVSNQEIEFASERAVIRSVVVARDWFAKYAIDTSAALVERFAFENAAQIDAAWESEKPNYAAGCPAIREVVVSLPPMALDDEKNPLRKKLEDARGRIAAGADFAQVAREVSTDSSAVLGGEVGCLSKAYGTGAEELLKAIEALKPGELSPVIDTPRGFHVVQLVERLDAAKLEPTARKQIARRLQARFAADEAASQFARNLIERAKGGQKLEEAVAELTRAALHTPPPKADPKDKDAVVVDPPALLAEDRPRFEISSPFSRSSPLLSEADPKEPIAVLAFDLKAPDSVFDRPIEAGVGFVVFQLKERTVPEAEQAKQFRQQFEEAKAADALDRFVADLRAAAGKKLKVDSSFAVERASADE